MYYMYLNEYITRKKHIRKYILQPSKKSLTMETTEKIYIIYTHIKEMPKTDHAWTL